MSAACAGAEREDLPGTVSGESPAKAFVVVAALIFGAGTAATIAWGKSMSSMDGMPMPGGWTMSMVWMRMPGQTWPGAASSFLGMWMAMMLPMMLPSLLPGLWRYRQLFAPKGGSRSDSLVALAGAAYYVVWFVAGIVAYALGVALAAIAMQLPAVARAVPGAGAVVVVIAGSLQFTRWKARQLACCRQAPGSCDCDLPATAATAWRLGLRLGLHCCNCCAGAMAVLLVVGVMDLRVMAVATAVITAERLAPGGAFVARVIGGGAVVAGLLLLARAAGSA